MSLSDTEISDEEIDYTEEIAEIEESFRKVIESLDACLKVLKGLKKERPIILRGKSLDRVIMESMGPNFGSNVLKFLKGE
jgi:hypothetical protein